MKKILFTLTIILITAALVACGNDADDYNGYQAEASQPQPTPPQIVIHTQENPPGGTGTTDVTNDGATHDIAHPTREALLADLDILIWHFEHTFPHNGVIYRRFGVDFLQNAAVLRVFMESDDFVPTWRNFYEAVMNNFFFHQNITYPVAAMAINNATPLPQNMQAWIETGLPRIEPDETTPTLPPVEVAILEEGRIGYIKINDFELAGLGAAGNAARIVIDFIHEIADFEHLIIDIRDARGGTPNVWENVLIAPNLQGEITRYFHAFTLANTRNTNALYYLHRAMSGGSGIWQRIAQTDIRPIAEMPMLPYLDTAVAANFSQGFTFGRTIGPQMAQFGAAPFAGQIWLLIGKEIGDAAAMFADLMHYTDIAILAGQPVGGNTSMLVWAQSLHDMAVILPETNVMFFYNLVYTTDHLGRAVDEYVTRPHVYNMEGMDALETVLALIESGVDLLLLR